MVYHGNLPSSFFSWYWKFNQFDFSKEYLVLTEVKQFLFSLKDESFPNGEKTIRFNENIEYVYA